jgi:hypothetical protein
MMDGEPETQRLVVGRVELEALSAQLPTTPINRVRERYYQHRPAT